MAEKHTVVARGNPQDAAAAHKHHPQARSTSKVTLQDLASRAAELSTLRPAAVAAAVEVSTLRPSSPGRSPPATWSTWGSETFSLRTHSAGADMEEEVSARNITKTMMSLRPDRRFKDILYAITDEELHERAPDKRGHLPSWY